MWTYSPQNRQVGSAFALTYRLRLRSCKLLGAFVISPLPPMLLEPVQTAGSLRSADTTPLLRYCGPVRHPLAFRPTSRCRRLYGFLLRRFRDGARRASPVARCILVIVLPLLPRHSVPPHRSVGDVPCCLRPINGGSASEVEVSGPPVRSFSLRPNDSLTIPRMALSIDFRGSVSFPPGYPSYRTLTFVLVGLPPTEYTSLRWTYADSSSSHDASGCIPYVLPFGGRTQFARSCRCLA